MRNEKAYSRKSVRWSAVLVPCLSLGLKVKGKQGRGPKGVYDLCFHRYGEFHLLFGQRPQSKGTMSCRTQGGISRRPSIRPSFRPSFPPGHQSLNSAVSGRILALLLLLLHPPQSPALRPKFQSRPKSLPQGPNPSL